MKPITRFTHPDVVSQISTKLLTELFDRFKVELEAAKVVVPNPNLADGNYYQGVAELFKSPGALPEKLVEALNAIEELASPENKPLLEAAFWDAPEHLCIPSDASPEETALQIWLNAPYSSGPPQPPAVSSAPTVNSEPSNRKNPASIPPCELDSPKPSADAMPKALPPGRNPVPAPPANPVKPPPAHRRNGRVARLPKAARDRINEMLLDGFTYPEIIRELAEDGKSLNPESIGTWYAGGYQDWLKERQRREDMRVRQELAMDLGQKEGSDLSQAAFQIAVTQICETLEDFDPTALRLALQKDPKNYTRLLNALPNLSEGELKCERHRTDAAERRARLEKARSTPLALGLSDQTRLKIEEERFTPPAQ